MPDESKKGEYTVVGGASPTGRSWHFGGDHQGGFVGGAAGGSDGKSFDIKGSWDDPEMDESDRAHPAWWRGHDKAFSTMCRMVNEILDGKEPAGVSNQPWQSLRERLWKLHKDTHNQKSVRSDDMFKNADFRTVEERISFPFPPPPWPKDKTQRVFLSSAEPKRSVGLYAPTSETIQQLCNQLPEGWSAKWKITRTIGETTTVEEFELTVPAENKD